MSYTEIVETVDGAYMVLVNGFQVGGEVDASGAGNATFATPDEAQAFLDTLDEPATPKTTDILVTNVDLKLLREQRDELIAMADRDELYDSYGDTLDGLLNLLDWMLDEAEGYGHP